MGSTLKSAEKVHGFALKVQNNLYSLDKQLGTILPRHLIHDGPEQFGQVRDQLQSALAEVHKLVDVTLKFQKDYWNHLD